MAELTPEILANKQDASQGFLRKKVSCVDRVNGSRSAEV
jgi:hypothetical protein